MNMSKLERKIENGLWKARLGAVKLASKAKNAIKNEDGDTNFLSIIIILAIVLVVAVIFIALKDKIVKLVSDEWTIFSEKFGNQSKTIP